jgi:DNA-binding MarR family transcriptional regulator
MYIHANMAVDLQQEKDPGVNAKMSDTSKTPMTCTCGRLRMASRRVSRIYDRHLAPAGVGIAQFGLLATILSNDGASVTTLAAILEMERTTLTRNLQPLEREGLLRIDQGADQRTRAVRITDAGRAVLKKGRPLWLEAQRAIETSLGPQHLAALHECLGITLELVPEG